MRKLLLLFTALVLSVMTFAQSKVITGKVVDQQNQPIPFSSVHIKGTKSGVVADAEGNYSIKVAPGQTLVVSGAGLVEKEVTVGSSSTIDFAITRKESSMTEVVVTALGIRKESKALGYSTATVSSEQLNSAKPVNVAQGLIGQVSGAQISVVNNGVDPQIRVQLRGERHINFDNQALIVVDGMQVPSTLLPTINPEDIESTTILKGASAAALYGSQATNGVVIITTKKGSKGNKASINVNQAVTLEKMAYFPALQTTFSGYGGETGSWFDGTQYQFNAINPYTGFTQYIPFENQQYGPAFNGDPALAYIGSPDQNGNVYSVPFKAQKTDPRRAFFVNGVTSQTDASIATGDAKNSNFVGLQYVNVKGTTPKDVARRASVRIGGRRTYGMFSYDYGVSYVNKYSNTVGLDFTGQPVYWSLLNTPANIPMNAMKDWQSPNSPGNISNYYNAYYTNPYWTVDNSRQINKSDNLVGVLGLNLKPAEWISATYRISALVINNIYEADRNLAQFTDFSKLDTWGAGSYQAGGNVPGAADNQTTLTRNIQQDALVTVTHNFGDLNATMILGNTIQDQYTNQQFQFNGNLYVNGLYNLNYSTGIPTLGTPIDSRGISTGYLGSSTTSVLGSEGKSEQRLIGSYADLQLNYKDFLFLHGDYRHDKSSLLAPGHNGYDVYGIDAAWAFTENLGFLKSNNILTFGKLRAAYSQTGQITLNPYSTVNTFSTSNGTPGLSSPGYPYGGLASLSLSQTYNNPNLTPEMTREKEAGIELSFLNNRIQVGFTYYYDDNLKQLFPVSITSASGYTKANVNAARTVSTGTEYDLKLSIIKSKDFKFDINSNLAIQTTTVKSLYGGAQNFDIGNSNSAIVGYAFPELYVQDLKRYQGKVVVDGTTGLPSLSSTFVAAGRTTPKYILGLTPTFGYKNFTLQVIADYRGGYVFYNNAELNLDFTGASAHTATNGRQNFIYPNSVVMDASSGKYVPNTTVYTQDGNIGFWAYSSYRKAGTSYVENASAWKIRTINLTYDFTGMISKSMSYVKGLKLSALVNNAFMFRPKENDFTDPEFNASNANGLGYNTVNQLPPTRQFTLVLGVKF